MNSVYVELLWDHSCFVLSGQVEGKSLMQFYCILWFNKVSHSFIQIQINIT